MEHLKLGEIPPLRDPVLILAFSGWSDAGQAATGAARFLVEQWGATRVGEVDPEEFFNFTEQRPTVRIAEGSLRRVEWPGHECYIHTGSGRRDFVIWTGPEPHLRWRMFTDIVVEVVSRTGATLALSLGGLLADVPHSRPVRVTGATTDEALTEAFAHMVVRGSRYEGPTGILGVLSDRFRQLGLASASLWANVPHYINATANPKAALALIERVDDLFHLDMDLSTLRDSSETFDREVSEAVASDTSASEYVRQLEDQVDDDAPDEPRAPLPSGDAIVRELEEFLRRQQDGDDDDDD